jgi:hypothetical protein
MVNEHEVIVLEFGNSKDLVSVDLHSFGFGCMHLDVNAHEFAFVKVQVVEMSVFRNQMKIFFEETFQQMMRRLKK